MVQNNVAKRIAKNTVALFASQMIGTIFALVLSIFIARSLGDVLFGRYSFVIAFTGFFAVFLDLGYDTLLIRDVSRNKSQANRYLNNILMIRSLLSLLIFGIIVVTINVLGYPAEIKNIVYLFSIYILIVSLSTVFRVTFRAFEKMEYDAFIKIFASIIRLSLGFLVLFFGYGLIALGLVFLISAVVNLLISFLICERKIVKSKTEMDFGFLKSTIKIALPLGMLTIFGFVYVKIDRIMLSVMEGDAVVGWYSAASNLILGFVPVPHLFMHALFPLMSYYYVASKDSLKKTYEKAFKYLFILGLPLVIGISLLADRFILLIYGERFSGSILILQILAWDVLLKFLYICSGFVLISTDKQNQMAKIVGCTALLNVVLNLLLIPSYSYIGAAIATIASEVFLLISYIYINYRNSYSIPLHKISAKPIVACAIMGFFIYQFSEINLILLITVSTILYFGLLYTIRGFSKDDMSLFKQLIKR
jgi:O-antigen/teichoic acid export membrane protein